MTYKLLQFGRLLLKPRGFNLIAEKECKVFNKLHYLILTRIFIWIAVLFSFIIFDLIDQFNANNFFSTIGLAFVALAFTFNSEILLCKFQDIHNVINKKFVTTGFCGVVLLWMSVV